MTHLGRRTTRLLACLAFPLAAAAVPRLRRWRSKVHEKSDTTTSVIFKPSEVCVLAGCTAGDPTAFKFTKPMSVKAKKSHQNCDFSYAGLKVRAPIPATCIIASASR